MTDVELGQARKAARPLRIIARFFRRSWQALVVVVLAIALGVAAYLSPGLVQADVHMPCATQNDVNINSAKKIAASGSKYYIEVANMPTTNDALAFLKEQKHMIVAPSKAVNAGGVATSALEMSQNSQRLSWSAEEVDAKLHTIMKNIHDNSA